MFASMVTKCTRTQYTKAGLCQKRARQESEVEALSRGASRSEAKLKPIHLHGDDIDEDEDPNVYLCSRSHHT